jgi:hypothetical protein
MPRKTKKVKSIKIGQFSAKEKPTVDKIKKLAKLIRCDKALTPEEEAVVEQILSLLAQLKQGGTVETVEEVVEESEVEDIELSDDEEEIELAEDTDGKPDDDDEKDKEEKAEGEGGTASDDAEDRIDGANPDVTEESLQEVEKSLRTLKKQLKQTSVNKSVNSRITKSMDQIVKNQSALLKRIKTHEMALKNIITGLGVANQIETTYKAEFPAKKPETSSNVNAESVIKALANLENFANKSQDDKQPIRSNLGGINVEQTRKDVGDLIQLTTGKMPANNNDGTSWRV